MRILYAFLSCLFISNIAFAQITELPYADNAVRRHHTTDVEQDLLQKYQAISGEKWDRVNIGAEKELCPPQFFNTIFVESGESDFVTVDTILLGGGPGTTLEIVDCSPVQYAANIFMEGTFLVYESMAGVDAGVDTVCVEFCKGVDDCTTFTYVFTVKRAGMTHILPEEFLSPFEFVGDFCVDETLLPGPLACNQFIPCGDDYDGEGSQVIDFIYQFTPTGCINYTASGFGGTDEVCFVLCDSFSICDTFRLSFTIESDVLDLPFFDDFTYDGAYPSTDFWLDRHVYRNNTLAPNPPSLGMVSFDGLDRTGTSYLSAGKADYLTSKPIDLQGQQEVFLNFYAAPKGYGLYPNESDSLAIEFRNSAGEWVAQQAIPGFNGIISSDSLPPFEFYALPVLGGDFLHDEFQFRFSNSVTPAPNAPVGLHDMWHLDYVYLDAGLAGVEVFADLTQTREPSPVLKTYTGIPYKHLNEIIETEVNDTIITAYHNLSGGDLGLNNGDLSLLEKETNTPIGTINSQVVSTDIESNEFTSVRTGLSSTSINSIVDGIKDNTNFNSQSKLTLELTSTFTNTTEASLFLNNNASSKVYCSNYFAYDDGTAERALQLKNPDGFNPQVATRFKMEVDDTLRAIQVHFPRVSAFADDQVFNINIYVDALSNEPAFQKIFTVPFYADMVYDTLQGFTTYELKDFEGNETPLFIPAGTDFYVGFQQVTITEKGIPLGFDKNKNNAANQWVDNTGQGLWELFPANLFGTLLMRAVVGDGENVYDTNNSVADLSAEIDAFPMYPNPANTSLFFDLTDKESSEYTVDFVNHTGQLVKSTALQSEINVLDLPVGVYFVKITHRATQQFTTQKLLIIR